MKADKKRIELAMARACMNTAGLSAAAGISGSTARSVISGKGARPRTLGRIARALGVDPAEIIMEEE